MKILMFFYFFRIILLRLNLDASMIPVFFNQSFSNERELGNKIMKKLR